MKLQWVNTFGGVNDDYVYDIEIDNEGNILVSGTIRRTANFSDEVLGDPMSQSKIIMPRY